MSGPAVIDLTGSPTPSASSKVSHPPSRPTPTPTPTSTSTSTEPSTNGRPSNFQPRSGAKRLVIKNLRTTPRVSAQEYAARIWSQLDEALTAIFAGTKVSHSLEELYRGVENVCRQDGAPLLFESLQRRVEGHFVAEVKRPLLEQASTSSSDRHARDHVQLLGRIRSSWLDWNAKLVRVSFPLYRINSARSMYSSYAT